MRALVLAVLFCAGAANAAEEGITVRPLAGVGASASDSGFGVGAQLGLRISPILLRVTLDLGGSNRRGYALETARADWVHDLPDHGVALFAGVGFGSLLYGFILDSPTDYVHVVTPEVGLLFGPNRTIGRLLLGITGVIPVEALSHERDFAGQEIEPPRILATALLSF